MFDAALSPQQQQVINALSEGLNSTDAAALAGVHRNTIANWRRNSLYFRDKTEDRLDRAFETLDAILSDPEASLPPA